MKKTMRNLSAQIRLGCITLTATLIVAVSCPPRAIACFGTLIPACNANPTSCLKSLVLTKSVTSVPVSPPAGGAARDFPVRVGLGVYCPTVNNCGTPCPGLTVTQATVFVGFHKFPCPSPLPPPDASGLLSTTNGTLIAPLCNSTNSYTVQVRIPPGIMRGLYCVKGTATVSFSDGATLTQTGDTIICIGEEASGLPGVPRLDMELLEEELSGPIAYMAPGDQAVAKYRITNNDPTLTVDLSAFANSRQGAIRPQGGNEAQGVFAISNPYGDDFPIAIDPEVPEEICIPLPDHPYTQPEIRKDGIQLAPGESTIVKVAIRSYGQCASGSCSESTLRVAGRFSDGTEAEACLGMAAWVDTRVPVRNCGRESINGMPANDCDNDGIVDAEEILSGSSFDVNANAMPDDCEQEPLLTVGAPLVPASAVAGEPIRVEAITSFNSDAPVVNVWANGVPLSSVDGINWQGTIPADTRGGPQTVQFVAKDTRGQMASDIGTYLVSADTTPPVLSCPTNIELTTDAGQCSRIGVTYLATATDDRPGTVVTCSPPSGSAFPIGVTAVTCTATDASGNTSHCTFTVTIVESAIPRLSLARQEADVVITWPQTCAEYALAETSNLNESVAWSPTTAEAIRVGGNLQVTLPIAAGNKLYRLVQVTPQFEILLPRAAVVTGRQLVMLRQQAPYFDAARVTQVIFDFASIHGGVWQTLRTISGGHLSVADLDPNNWQTEWDTTDVAPGPYILRATIRYVSGPSTLTASTAVTLVVNKAPVVSMVVAEGDPEGGQVMFDASNAEDMDGSVTNWMWDFGDPVANASATYVNGGRVATTLFTDTTGTNHVVLTVTDDHGAQTSAYYTLRFDLVGVVLGEETHCKCKSILVRTRGNASDPSKPIGPGLDTNWGKRPGAHDGKTLGPLHGNPENRSTSGEKSYSGFAFEVIAEVEGDPSKCKEIQLVKATATGGSPAVELHATWRGEGDRNKDGNPDMNITGEQSCMAAGGSWNGVTGMCEFPKNGDKYRPDGGFAGVHGDPGVADYQAPLEGIKAYGPRVIKWWDAPRLPSNYSTLKADFVAIVRGDDGKYCYVKFGVDLERKAGRDKEDISPAPDDNGNINGTHGADSVPGVP